jgi:hypothetical protein
MSDTDYRMPCGALVEDDRYAAVRHAAGCVACRRVVAADAVAERGGPSADSEAHRRGEAVLTAEMLGLYAAHVSSSPDPQQVHRLAMALARVETVLWYETGGLMGDRYSHADKVLGRYPPQG